VWLRSVQSINVYIEYIISFENSGVGVLAGSFTFALVQARAMASGMPGQQRSRKLGYMLSGSAGNASSTPRGPGRHSSPLNGNR
jgi:hypothetical protein